MNFFKIFLGSTKDVDGYENLQKRINEKNEFLEKVFNSFNELNRYLKDFLKRMIQLNSNYTNITFSLEEQNIQETCKLIYQKIIENLEKDSFLVENLLKNISEHIKNFNNEKSFYEEFKKINKELQEEKERLKKNKEIYHKAGKEAENKIKKFVENNFQILDNLPEESQKELDSIALPPTRALNNYKISVEKVNQLVNKFNNKQSELFDYLPDLGNEDGVFFFRLVKLYLSRLEEGEKYLNTNKKNFNESKSLETDSKLKELIEKSEINKKDEKPIDLMQYQSGLDFNKCKNKKEFDLIAKSIETINEKINKDIFPNYNYENEFKNYEEGLLIKELFEDKELDEKKAEKFLDSLKDITVHKGVYIVLSQLRTNSRFQRSKDLIELFGKAFNILLEAAQKNNLYENAKNCIILSQTYFYSDENKNKIYVFDYIKDNKWLIEPNFWRGFINFMIVKEFERFEKTFPDTIFNIEGNINITKKIKDKLNEVVFSQLLPFVSNMIDFGIDKRIILKITDEFVEKYNYLSPDNLENLFSMISHDKEEIEKLRKEYTHSLELKTEIINSSNDKNSMDNKMIRENNEDKIVATIENFDKKETDRKGEEKNELKEENKIENNHDNI